MGFDQNIWFDYFVFGVLVTSVNGINNLMLADNSLSLKIIGKGLFFNFVVASILYNLGYTVEESFSIFFAAMAINSLYLLYAFAEQKKKNKQ